MMMQPTNIPKQTIPNISASSTSNRRLRRRPATLRRYNNMTTPLSSLFLLLVMTLMTVQRVESFHGGRIIVVVGRGSTSPRTRTYLDNLDKTKTTNFQRSPATTLLCATLNDDGDDTNDKNIEETTASASFGDVVPMTKRRPIMEAASDDDDDEDPFQRLASVPLSSKPTFTSSSTSTTTTLLDSSQGQRRRNNLIVALASIGLALANYTWQYLHPLAPISILYQMQQTSAPITVIGTTSKPTVVDFWAPWCENCKQLAPTLYQVEQEFSGDINFVTVNGDDANAWPLIEAFGVDAIPHLALVEADGTVSTALIGPVPKEWLRQDFQVLVENAKDASSAYKNQEKRPLPFRMLDVFANRPPEDRRIAFKLED